MRNVWRFTQLGSKVTSDFGTHPADVLPGRYPQLIGVDGRYSGEIRRYPGHVPYDHTFTDGALTSDDYVFTISQIEPFEVASGNVFGTVLRGFVVKGTNSTGVECTEIWYNSLGSTTSSGGRQLLTSDTKGCFGSFTTGDSSWTIDDAGTLSSDDPIVISEVMFDDGSTNGSVQYAAITGITHIGARQVGSANGGYGVIRKVDGKWFPVGKPAFNSAIWKLRSIGGKLYAVGSFTTYAGKPCVGVAIWNGIEWTSPAWDPAISLNFRGTVMDICESPFSDGVIYICGDLEFDDSGWTAATVLLIVDTAGVNSVIRVPTDVSTYDPTGDGYAMCACDGKLYLTGNNVKATGTPACKVVVQVDNKAGFVNVVDTGFTGTAGTCYAMVASGTTLYTAQGVYVQSFNGTTWADISPTGVAHDLMSLAVDGSRLWVGGTGLTTGTYHAFLAHRDGTTWTTVLNPGITTMGDVPDYIRSLTVASPGLLVGGGFISPYNEPTYTTATRISVSTRGQYLYIFASNGDHKTLWWNGSAFTVARFGPQYMYLPAPSAFTDVTGTGKMIAGQYLTRYRYRHVARGIYTSLSDPSGAITAADGDHGLVTRTEASVPLPPDTFPNSLDRVQILQTLSSLDADYPAGGSLFVAAQASFGIGTAAEGFFSAILEGTSDYDQGNGTFGNAMDDASLASDTSFYYDPWSEDVTEIGHVFAACCYLGTNFAVERVQGAVLLRWSATSRSEPENFPVVNEYWTKIRVGDVNTCRLVPVGDFLILFGGDRVYRIQKAGASVGVFELCNEFKCVSSTGYVVLGQKIYIVTEIGLVMVDVSTGGYQVIPGLDRLFLQRWRNKLTGVTGAYDARMSCVYFHVPTVHETLCVWPQTSMVSLLVGSPAEGVAEQHDLDGDGPARAYFWGSNRIITTPNWLGTGIQSMTGFTATPITAPDGSYGTYNGALGTLNPMIVTTPTLGTTSTVTVYGVWPSSSTFPNQMVGVFVVFADGTLGQISGATPGSTTTQLTITSVTVPVTSVGDRLSIDPVILCLVGSSLWAPTTYIPQYVRGVPDHTARKKLDGATVLLDSITCQSAVGTNAPATLTEAIGIGAIRSPTETRASPMSPLVPLEGVGYTQSSLATGRTSQNEVAFHADGELLYPVLLSVVSNLGFSVLSWHVRGEFSESEKAGPSQVSGV